MNEILHHFSSFLSLAHVGYLKRETFPFWIYSHPTELTEGWWEIQEQICSLSPRGGPSALCWVSCQLGWRPVATVLLPSSELCIDLWKPANDPKHSPRTLFNHSTHSLWGPSLSPMMSHTNSVLMTWLLNLFPQMSSRPVHLLPPAYPTNTAQHI